MGTQMEGEKLPKTSLFLIGQPVGSPGEPEVTQTEPKGVKMTPGGPRIKVSGTFGS